MYYLVFFISYNFIWNFQYFMQISIIFLIFTYIDIDIKISIDIFINPNPRYCYRYRYFHHCARHPTTFSPFWDNTLLLIYFVLVKWSEVSFILMKPSCCLLWYECMMKRHAVYTKHKFFHLLESIYLFLLIYFFFSRKRVVYNNS